MDKSVTELKREKKAMEQEKQRVVLRYDERINEIQTAIDKMTKDADSGLLARRSQTAAEEIYKILAFNPPLHVDSIFQETKLRGWKIKRQSISSLLSTRAKRGDTYKRVGPNIFTLVDKE